MDTTFRMLDDAISMACMKNIDVKSVTIVKNHLIELFEIYEPPNLILLTQQQEAYDRLKETGDVSMVNIKNMVFGVGDNYDDEDGKWGW